jgi:hypothetical protein
MEQPLKNDIQDEAAGKSKEIMEKVKAALLLFQHQNENKIPEMEDLITLLSPQKEQENSEEPRILSFKVYVGKSDSPLYYHDPATGSYFDTNAKHWVEQKPPFIDHLNERDIQGSDVFDAILHGVVDDNDYQALEKVNQIEPRAKQLWSKLSELKNQTQLMQKSVEEDLIEDSKKEDLKDPNNYTAEKTKDSGNEEAPESEGEGTTEETVQPEPKAEDKMPGSNVLQMILDAARKNAENSNLTLENLRSMIRSEIKSLMNETTQPAPEQTTSDVPSESKQSDAT